MKVADTFLEKIAYKSVSAVNVIEVAQAVVASESVFHPTKVQLSSFVAVFDEKLIVLPDFFVTEVTEVDPPFSVALKVKV